MKFGYWTVIKKSDKKSKNTYWRCLCVKCNREYDVSGVNLKNNSTTMCNSCARFNDLTGKKFNKLTVLKLLKRGKSSVWECLCDCGKVTTATSAALTCDRKLSCGCTKNTLKKYNTYDLTGDYGVGYTSKHEEFYFDICDYEVIKDVCWHIDGYGYVVGRDTSNNGEMTKMHKFITGNDITDHVNRIKHDNRRLNLRKTTAHLNSLNRTIASNNTSGIIGVSYDRESDKWSASIKYGDIYMSKLFNKKEDAIRKRLEWEIEVFGEYAPQVHLIDMYT